MVKEVKPVNDSSSLRARDVQRSVHVGGPPSENVSPASPPSPRPPASAYLAVCSSGERPAMVAAFGATSHAVAALEVVRIGAVVGRSALLNVVRGRWHRVRALPPPPNSAWGCEVLGRRLSRNGIIRFFRIRTSGCGEVMR